MPQIDKEKYFNYRTGPVNLLTGDVIDTSKTGMSFYDDLLPNGDPDYMRDEHNLVAHIEYMTPNEYYEQCSLYGFPGGIIPVEKLKQERRIDKKTLEHLKDVLTDYGHKFPIPFVNKAERGQEGLHRMMVLGDMFGWDKGKYPVLVITWADDDRAKRDKQARIDNDIRQDIKSGVQKALHFTYYNIEEFKEQLQYSLDSSFEFSDYVKPPVQFTLTDGKTWPDEDYAVTVNNVSYEFEKSSVRLKEPQPVDDDLNDVDIDIDDIELDELDDFEDTEDFLKRYFGDNWRETNPELKKTFGIKEAVERLDLKQMDDAILSEWGANTPNDGCIFIHPSGTFINIYPKLDDHEDLCYWLEEEGFGDNPEDPAWFVDEFKYIRCRNNLHLCFIELPTEVTRQQVRSLEEWMETKVSTDFLDIEAPNGEWKHYNLDEYFPEDLIKIIRRFYSSGKLYEDISDIKHSWSKETAHPTAQKYWTEDKPSLGQCAITALYLNEKYGYSIWETLINNRNRHFFNKDNDGNIIDLTKDQFSSNVEIDYGNSKQRDPKQLLRSCNTRYQLFKKNLNNI